MTRIARRNPVAAFAVALVLGIVIALNADAIAMAAVMLVLNVGCCIAIVLVLAHLFGGETARKRLQAQMLRAARNASRKAKTAL